jgi:hypothetical protein
LGRDKEALGAEEFADPFIGMIIIESIEMDIIVPIQYQV